MGNTGLGKHKDVHNSDSTLEFETGKKMFPSEQEAKMILSGECHVILCMIPISMVIGISWGSVLKVKLFIKESMKLD